MRCGAPRGSVDRRAAHRNMGAPPPCSGRPSPGRLRQRPAYLRAVRRRRTLMTSRHRAATRWRWSRRGPVRHHLARAGCGPARPALGAPRRRPPPRQALIVRYLREFVAAPGGRRLLALVALFTILLQGLGLVLPTMTRTVVDTMVPGRRTDLLPVLGFAILGTALLNSFLSLAKAWSLLALRARADTVLSGRFMR